MLSQRLVTVCQWLDILCVYDTTRNMSGCGTCNVHSTKIVKVMVSCYAHAKSTLERVSNPCINGVFHELGHKSVMNIILRPSVSS